MLLVINNFWAKLLRLRDCRRRVVNNILCITY